MQEGPWYLKEPTVEEYEAYYLTKYRRADTLEKKLLKKLLEQFNDIEKILEVGCGTGHFTRWMESLGFNCFGLDVSRLILKEARKHWFGGRLVQGEAGHLPFGTKSFDVVAYVASLEYMTDLEAVFAEACRVAKKGIVIGLMNSWSLPTMQKTIRARLGKSVYYRNARFYSISGTKRILDKTFSERFNVAYWSTTVFPRAFGNVESALFPFGSFLGVAVKLESHA